jgi:CheY-like chemotaxis protein
VGNAVKFTPEGEVVVTVGLGEPASSSGMLQFSVRDTGIGIPTDKQDRLFKSFSQVDSSTTRQFGGTGLGLAISKRLAEAMGGRLWVESEPGKGSTFHFTIRIRPAPDISADPLEIRYAELSGKRLLVVEDNATSRRILVNWLEKFGMVASAVETAEAALHELQNGSAYDAIILDFQLPGIDVLSLAGELRKLPVGPSLHLLLLTSTHLRAGDPRAAAARVSVSVYKPVRPHQLIEALVQSFDHRRASARKPPAAPWFDSSLASRLPLRILVADDNRVNQKVASSFLDKLGYRTEVVGNGLEVLQALEQRPFDIIFLDVQMPEMDGYEAARQLRIRWPGEERPRIIAMTGNAMQGDREQCLAAGMDDYITKPVRPEDLRSALERWGANVDQDLRGWRI